MKREIIVASTIAYLVSVSAMQSAQAQIETTASTASPPLVNDIGSHINWLDEQGSSELQEKVLMQINKALVNGWLSPEDASQYKVQLNKVNDKESWYQSFRMPIPKTLIANNVAFLTEMSRKLQPQTLPPASAGNSLHADIDNMIGNALARNRISSSQAETYYLRLAQIESNLESAKASPLGDEKMALNKILSQLKAELKTKVD